MTIAAPQLESISLELLDAPSLAMREAFDERALNELADDIRANGLIQPIIVKRLPTGRYEVIAGHRRSIACRLAGVLSPPCIVRDADASTTERLKVSENRHRENVNPIHEASYFAELLEHQCGDDVDRLCEFVGQSRTYVETRLNLLRGDQLVVEALKADQISLSVAVELNKFSTLESRRVHLESAKNGATARTVREWRRADDSFIARQGDALAGPGADGAGAAAVAAPSGPACLVCGKRDAPHLLTLVYVHGHCDMAILKPLLDAYNGGGRG